MDTQWQTVRGIGHVYAKIVFDRGNHISMHPLTDDVRQNSPCHWPMPSSTHEIDILPAIRLRYSPVLQSEGELCPATPSGESSMLLVGENLLGTKELARGLCVIGKRQRDIKTIVVFCMRFRYRLVAENKPQNCTKPTRQITEGRGARPNSGTGRCRACNGSRPCQGGDPKPGEGIRIHEVRSII